MEVIQRVQRPRATGAVPLPAQPHASPSVRDVMNARAYKREIEIPYQRSEVNARALTNAMEYKAKIIQARGGAGMVPAWFWPAMQELLQPINDRLDAVEDRLDAMEGRLDTMEGRFDAVEGRLGRLEGHASRILAAKSHNRQYGDGSKNPYVVVPFRDGTDPTLAPHLLPRLESEAGVRRLAVGHCCTYYVGYYGPGGPTSTAKRKKRILLAIRGSGRR